MTVPRWRRGQKTKRRQITGRRSTAADQRLKEKDNSALFPHTHTQLLSQLISNQYHITEAMSGQNRLHASSPTSASWTLPEAGLAQSVARRRQYCRRLTQNLLPLLFTFDRIKPRCLEIATQNNQDFHSLQKYSSNEQFLTKGSLKDEAEIIRWLTNESFSRIFKPFIKTNPKHLTVRGSQMWRFVAFPLYYSTLISLWTKKAINQENNQQVDWYWK